MSRISKITTAALFLSVSLAAMPTRAETKPEPELQFFKTDFAAVRQHKKDVETSLEIVKKKCKECTEERLNEWRIFLSKIDNPERFARLFKPEVEFPVIRAPSDQELGSYKRLQQAEEDKLIVKDAKVEPYQPSEGDRYAACMNQFHNDLRCNEAGDRLAIGVMARAAAIAALAIKADADFEKEISKLPPEERAFRRQQRRARNNSVDFSGKQTCRALMAADGYRQMYIDDRCGK